MGSKIESSSIQSAIIKTLLYSDIFDYPLSQEEIWKFLISPKKVGRIELQKILKESNLSFKDNYYFVSENSKSLNKRKKREMASIKKLILAKNIINKLSILPTVKFIGISGSLALLNCEEKDDIDIFVITSKGSLWLTRFLMIIILKIMGKHRGKGDKNIKNKFCLNMMIDQSYLAFPKNRRNLYTAHEIIQILPVLEKEKIFQKFLTENLWVKKYLPNIKFPKKIRNKKRNSPFYLSIVEFFFRNLQILILKRGLTNETVEKSFFAFHPFDYKASILEIYGKKLRMYKLLEDY